MSMWDGSTSPWEQPISQPWEKWWAWYPIKTRVGPGLVCYVFFETVWRRRNKDRWEYELYD